MSVFFFDVTPFPIYKQYHKAYFRKAEHACGMNKKDILVNLGQFEDETSPKQQKVVLKFLECENAKKILKDNKFQK